VWYFFSGEFIKSAEHLEASVAAVEAVYGPDSIELGHELQKLSEVLISGQQWKKALAANQRAVTIFEKNYGQSHNTVKDLHSAQMELEDVIKMLKL